ncbi:MAG: Ig-like domain-containing protein [Candidatus Azobacteroides sp.]|nr:Ig-like domain-containing protein [Candidatus Azobacteroides sp.]
MKKQLLNVFAIASFLFASLSMLKAQDVIFETDFTAAEGWVAEGNNASTNDVTVWPNGVTVSTQKIPYEGKDFTFTAVRCGITPTGKGAGTCSVGYVDLGKNDNSDMTKTGIGKTAKGGYFLLPVFDDNVQVSFYYASSAAPVNRTMVIEYSQDGGNSWMADDNTVAPQFAHPGGVSSCQEFVCPKEFPAGTPIRITVHSNGGAILLYHLKVVKFVKDVTPPELASSVPANEETEISPALREVKMTFSKPVKAGTSGMVEVTNLAGTSSFKITPGMLTFNQEEVTIPFPVDFHLNLNDTYYVIAERGTIQDLAENLTDADVVFAFQTKATGSNAKDILSFKINNQVGTEVIDAANATVSLVANFDVNLENDLQPVIEVSDLATVINDYKNFSQGPQVYTVIAEDGSVKNWTVTITQKQKVQAKLPVVYKGDADNTWKYIVADGWEKNLANDDALVKMNNIAFYQANISQAIYGISNYFEPGANRISFRIRYGNNTSNFQISLKESEDGDTWEDVVVYTPSGAPDVIPTATDPDLTPMIPTSSATFGLRSYPLKATSQYVKWTYDIRTSTSYYIDDVVIENAPVDNVAPTLLTSEEVTYANYSATKAQIFIPFSETLKVSEDLIKHNVAITLKGEGLSDVNLFEDNILTLRDGRLVLTNLTGALLEPFEYIVVIPNGALVDLANNPYAGGEVKFTTNVPQGIPSVQKQAFALYVDGGILNIVEPVAKVTIYNQLGMIVKTANTQAVPVAELKGLHIIKCTMPDGSAKIAKAIF